MTNDDYLTFVRKSRGQNPAMDGKGVDEEFLPSVRSLLADHDRRYHPNGYKPGQKCRYRSTLRELIDEDSFDPAQVSETAQMKLDDSEEEEIKGTASQGEADSVKKWLPKMKDEIFAKVGSLLDGASVKEDSSGIGYAEGPSVRNDDAVIDQIQAIVDAARAEYGLDKNGIRMAHYEMGSPYANKKPRIVFPFYKQGDAGKLKED